MGAGGAAREPREVGELPVATFAGTSPAPGAVLSLSEDDLSVLVHLAGRGSTTINFFWVFELFGVGGDTVCVSMNGRVFPLTSLPASLTLTASFLPRPGCGPRFDVDRARLRLTSNARPIFDEILAVRFHFEP